MRLQDIMTAPVETIGLQEKAYVANERMWRKQIHHLVVMEGERLAGVISDTDLGGEQARSIPDHLEVRDVMTPVVVTAEPAMTVGRAVRIFRERKIHCLPVVSSGRLVGIVTDTDIEDLVRRQGYPPLQSLRKAPKA